MALVRASGRQRVTTCYSRILPVGDFPGNGRDDRARLRLTGARIPAPPKCKGPLRLIALIKTEDIAKKILTAMHLPMEVPELHPARPDGRRR